MDKLKSLFTALRKLKAGCDHYDVALAVALAESVKLFLSGQFSIKEIVGYALYAPEIRRTLPVLISKERSLARLARINPCPPEDETVDKPAFYAKCQAAGLPIPNGYGVFQMGHGTDDSGSPLGGKDSWAAYFRAKLPTHFIVKDVAGVYASGFAAFERRGETFRRIGGEEFDAAGLYDHLCQRSASGIILQERLFDHPVLETLSGRPGLQTLRVNTYLNGNDAPSLLFYMIKMPVGDNIADNFYMGTTGNLLGVGRPDEGVLRGARVISPCGSGLTTIDTHPATGLSLSGFRLPLWQEAVGLAKQAHRVFSNFGTLGWDIALTAEGPRILEANSTWDPPTYAPEIMSEENWRRVFA